MTPLASGNDFSFKDGNVARVREEDDMVTVAFDKPDTASAAMLRDKLGAENQKKGWGEPVTIGGNFSIRNPENQSYFNVIRKIVSDFRLEHLGEAQGNELTTKEPPALPETKQIDFINGWLSRFSVKKYDKGDRSLP